jgi:hypothetical protein
VATISAQKPLTALMRQRDPPPATGRRRFLLFLNLVHKRVHECVYDGRMLSSDEIAI